jgi:hypothetical protein
MGNMWAPCISGEKAQSPGLSCGAAVSATWRRIAQGGKGVKQPEMFNGSRVRAHSTPTMSQIAEVRRRKNTLLTNGAGYDRIILRALSMKALSDSKDPDMRGKLIVFSGSAPKKGRNGTCP